MTWRSAGPPTARGWPSARHDRATADAEQMYTVPVAGGFPTEVPLPRVEEASYSADAPTWRTSPTSSGSRAGRGTGAGRPRRSGSRISPIPASSRCRRRATPTTGTRCGLATRSTSCPTATARPRCSPMTSPPSRRPRSSRARARLPFSGSRPRAIVIEAARVTQALRSRELDGQDNFGPHRGGSGTGAPAPREARRRQGDSQLRHLADWPARGGRGAR